jgi:hypothetical protein
MNCGIFRGGFEALQSGFRISRISFEALQSAFRNSGIAVYQLFSFKTEKNGKIGMGGLIIWQQHYAKLTGEGGNKNSGI